MRMATCICGDGGTVNVQGADYGMTFGRGSRVDLDAPVISGSAETWGTALGSYLHLFQEDDPPRKQRKQRQETEPQQE